MDVVVLRKAFTGLADLVLPRRCAGCEAPGTAWCPGCAAELGWPRRLDRPLLRAGPPTYALGRYRAGARKAVLQYKESGRRELAAPFGAALARGLHRIPAARTACWLVPAPSRRSNSRRRGGAHMARVAEHTAAVLGWPVAVADCLILRAGTRDSVGLTPEERRRNLSGRVALRDTRSPPPGAAVVLLDDVVTTGATVATSARVLAEAAISVVAVVSLTGA